MCPLSLGARRPNVGAFLVGLLDDGKIPHRVVGTHRRVMVADLLSYKERDSAHRREVADELAAEAQKHGLGY